jgi:hypothetical protein
MSFPAPGNAAIGEELRDEGGVRKALLNWFAAQGINPFQNPYAARLVGRSAEVAQLMPGYFQQDSDRQNFINQWAAQQWGGAAPSGGLDFSNKGIIGQIDQTRDINGTPTNLFRTGDSDADAQAIASWRNIANRSYGTQIQQTAARLEAEKGLQFGAWRQQNPTWSGQYADWRLGKTPVTQGFTPPSGTSTNTGFTPPGGTTPTGSTAYSQSAAGPQGSLTPPVTATGVNPNLTTFPSAPGNPWEPSAPSATPPTNPQNLTDITRRTATITPTVIPAGDQRYTASNAAITNWQQLLDSDRASQQNWGTRMMGNPSQGFSIGGITYDPRLEAAQGSQRYRNMSGSGRETARGSNWGVFLYRLDLLRKQRDAGGNAALGITRATTDDQLARMAAQFIQKNYVGTSAFTGV